MKRLHLHLKTDDLSRSVAFYTAMFGEEPSVEKSDYAKWMLEDPRVNLAISTHGGKPGIDHAGIQLDDDESLEELTARMSAAGIDGYEQDATTCCYARSNKTWLTDPQGTIWELFHSFEGFETYGAEPDREKLAALKPEFAESCCAPKA